MTDHPSPSLPPQKPLDRWVADKTKYPSWFKPAGQFLGIVIATAVVSLGSSYGLTKNVGADAKVEAKVEAKKTAKETAKASQMGEAMYLRALTEKIEAKFDELYADLDDLDDALGQCEEKAREAQMTANVALRVLESRYGTRSVERTFGTVEREAERRPAPPPPKAKARSATKLPTYQIAE